MKTAMFMLLPITALLFAGACAESVPGRQQVVAEGRTTVIKILEPKEAYALIQKNNINPDFVILDVRTPEEYESGHIEGAININYHSDDFVADLGKLDRSKTYFVYCRSGRRSADTVSIMVRLGFGNILRVAGDILRWKSEKLPLVK